MDAVRDSSNESLRNYAALAVELEHAIRDVIFDPGLLRRHESQRFFQELAVRFTQARDDLDAIGAFQALKPSLGISHLELIRNPRLASASSEDLITGDKKVDPNTFVRLGTPAPQVAFLRVSQWNRVAAAIDHAFERIGDARVLMIDIRGNPGGDATSMTPLAHMISAPVAIGAFFGRKWYELHGTALTPADFAGLRTVSSDSPPLQLFKTLREYGAVTAKAEPRAPLFSGTVYLLIDRSTASASEPLAHALKTSGRAKIIGERTAGEMLIALPHALSEGWVVRVPEADFIASDGTRLEAKGVEPDVKTSSNEVFLAVADQIEAMMPYSAAVLRAGSYETLKRAADAERSYRAALRLADQQHPAPGAISLVSVHKRLAAILTAKGDRDAAIREYSEVLKLAPDDAEALAAIHARRGN